MRVYLDTSAAMKLVASESESTALEQALNDLPADAVLLSSWLLHTELHCAAARRRGISGALIASVLDPLVLLDLEREDLLAAPTRGRGLRSQDALHLAVALRAEVDAIVTYDEEQAAAARAAGLRVVAPGPSGARDDS